MLNLLKIDLYKLLKNKTVRIFTAIYFICLLLLFALDFSKIDLGIFAIDFKSYGFLNFPVIWSVNSFFGYIISYLFVFVIILGISNEYSYGTLKQNLIDGLSKRDFITSKLLSLLFFSFLTTFLVFSISLIAGLSFSEDKQIKSIVSGLPYIGALFLKIVSLYMVFFFLTFLIKKSAIVMGAFIFWGVLEGIIRLLANYYDIHVYKDFLLVDFLPYSASSYLLPQPFSKWLSGVTNFDGSDIPMIMVFVNVVYIFLFLYGSYALLKRQDL